MTGLNGNRRNMVVIGGSAGALPALRLILGGLPPDFPGSIFVVVHLSSDYPSILPELLSSIGRLTAIHPHNRQAIEPNMVYVAPPDHHLLIEDSTMVVTRGPRENRTRPAIDPLFRSAAAAFGPRAVGVILSGMLDDGSAGLKAIKAVGGTTIVQDPVDAIWPDMPANALRYAHADHVSPARDIASLLVKSVHEAVNGQHRKKETAVSDIGREAQEADLEQPRSSEQPGEPSAFTCPECHGTLWELKDGELTRYRCRVGHAFTADTLNLAISEGSEQALWAAMRVMEEKAGLLRKLAPNSGSGESNKYRELARRYDQHVETIRNILVENQTLESRSNEDNKAA